RTWLVQFVEGQLSAPERQIRLSNIEGILSEGASIREITISDTEGVWLRIVNAAINWNQGALFTGRLEIRTLSAELIEVLRNPVPSDQPDIPAPEAGGLEDRKSTRLNSSHVKISYAVFCLKKKKQQSTTTQHQVDQK